MALPDDPTLTDQVLDLLAEGRGDMTVLLPDGWSIPRMEWVVYCLGAAVVLRAGFKVGVSQVADEEDAAVAKDSPKKEWSTIPAAVCITPHSDGS